MGGQMALFHGADVVVGFHGAPLVWVAMMAERGGALIEVEPANLDEEFYRCPEVWGGSPLGTFGGVARLAGVEHTCVRSGVLEIPDGAMEIWRKRSEWKQSNYVVDAGKVSSSVSTAVTRIAPYKRCRGWTGVFPSHSRPAHKL